MEAHDDMTILHKYLEHLDDLLIAMMDPYIF